MKKTFLLLIFTIALIGNVSARKFTTLKKTKSNSFCCLSEIMLATENTLNKNSVSIVPFSYNNRLISMKAGITNDQDQHEFILDSGAPTFLTDSMIKVHDLSEIKSETSYDADGNEQKMSIYYIKTMEIGGKKIKNTSAVSSQNVSKMPLLKGHHYAGLLGANAMRNSIWIINYQQHKITLTDNIENIKIPKDALSAKMKTDELNRPAIDVNIDGKLNLTFIVDLGYNGSMLLPQKLLSKPLFNDSLSFSKNESLSTGFASNVKQVEYKFLKNISIGNRNLENVKASTTGKNCEALIGNEFLENYIVILDFINKRIIFLEVS